MGMSLNVQVVYGVNIGSGEDGWLEPFNKYIEENEIDEYDDWFDDWWTTQYGDVKNPFRLTSVGHSDYNTWVLCLSGDKYRQGRYDDTVEVDVESLLEVTVDDVEKFSKIGVEPSWLACASYG